MTRSRTLVLLIALQLLATLLLTQTWYSISMAPNGQSVTLGDYSGSDANPSAMATSLFVTVAILVVGFTKSVARTIALAAVAISGVALAWFVTTSAIARNISALDSSLDRLTGIAQTHGITGLTINQNPVVWGWLASQVLVFVFAVGAIWRQKSWDEAQAAKQLAAAKTQNRNSKSGSNAKTPEPVKTAIDLWDEQRN